MRKDNRRAVIAALASNLCIALFKFAAALLSRSSSMLAESYHSVSDTFNQVLLLYGLKRSRRKPDAGHPFGHGKEQFFWSFMVAIVLFAIAGGLSIREGYHKLLHPEPIDNVGLAYLAIFVAFVFETIALRMAVRSLKAEKERDRHKTFFQAVLHTKDPTTLTVFFEDLLALFGLAIAAAGIFLVQLTGKLVIDAVASILIGSLLMIFALFLALETKKLLVGEGVSPYKRSRILEAVNAFDEVKSVLRIKTMHLSSDEVLVVLEVEFRDNLLVSELERINDRIEEKIRKILPNARIYLEAEDK